MPSAISPPAASVPVSVAARVATHASGPTSAEAGISVLNTVMLSPPTSANWARLNAVRIGMWPAVEQQHDARAEDAGEHQLGRVGEEQAGDERHLRERQRQRAVAEVDVDDEHLGRRERERERPPRQVDAAGRRLEMANDQHKQDRRHGSHGGDQCPDRSV